MRVASDPLPTPIRHPVLKLTLEPRLRNARYVGELVKLRVAPYGLLFSMLKTMLDDFASHNVDAVCSLLETTGRYLYKARSRGGQRKGCLVCFLTIRDGREGVKKKEA